MIKAGRKYTTFNKVRLSLFIRSYANHAITCYLRTRHKIDHKLTSGELRKKYSNKHLIPEISRLTKTLNFNYKLLWESIILNKNHTLGKRVKNRGIIKIYLSIENELILLAIAKNNKSNYIDPDYEYESALLSTAIERTVGNALKHIENDLIFEQQFEELLGKYRYLYYKTAYKYKLPTPRIVPFILRLIKD